MRTNFYGKIALGNLQKNGRFYIPYILTEAGLEASLFIVYTLARDERLSQVKGGSYIPVFMLIGTIVTLLITTILLGYMNSFLMKQRKHEYGLYNVLGMEKRHIGKIFFMESLISNAIALILGTISGIVFYKLCTMIICNLLHVKTVLGLYYVKPAIVIAVNVVFIVLDLITYIRNRLQISFMKPVELLQSRHTGEKEPKVNWLLFIPGVVCLGAGYYIAVTTKSPLSALNMFFMAVFLVIIGTYCLFVAGSIAVLRLLKANKKYYYHKRRMIAVSGMLYRMRQNAVGLASITILATAVLVMISTTTSLYVGIEDTLKKNFPSEFYYKATYDSEDGGGNIDPEITTELIKRAAEKNGLQVVSATEQKSLDVIFKLENGNTLEWNFLDEWDTTDVKCMTIITQELYKELTGVDLKLGENEAALANFNLYRPYPNESINLFGRELEFTQDITYFPISESYSSLIDAYGMVVSSEAVMEEIFEGYQAALPEGRVAYYDTRTAYNFDNRNLLMEVGDQMEEDLGEMVSEYVQTIPGASGAWGSSSDAIWSTSEELYGMYGTLFFLGLILGFIFLFATALIIYYKQISEGYEDRNRFQIMSKIGLSSDEIRKTIGTQILLVFFLPLVAAGIHTAFAFPILEKLLRIFLLSATSLFIKCTLLSFAGFAIIYTGIYLMTAKVYYRIVN